MDIVKYTHWITYLSSEILEMFKEDETLKEDMFVFDNI